MCITAEYFYSIQIIRGGYPWKIIRTLISTDNLHG